jgi:hypothetical protein
MAFCLQSIQGRSRSCKLQAIRTVLWVLDQGLGGIVNPAELEKLAAIGTQEVTLPRCISKHSLAIDGEVTLDFREEGLVCEALIPSEHVIGFEE